MWSAIWNELPKGRVGLISTFLLTIMTVEIVLTCALPLWREYFFDIMQTKEGDKFTTAILLLFVLSLSLGGAQGLKVWVGKQVSFIVRSTGTALMFRNWSAEREPLSGYNQPITQALRTSTELLLRVAVEIVISLSIVIVLLITNWHQPKILLAALVYTIVASVAALLFNKPLINTGKNWQSAEGLWAQSVSSVYYKSYGGDFPAKWQAVALSYYHNIRIEMYFAMFGRLKGSLSSIVPYLLLASAYFSGALTLGEFMAAVGSFELIVINSTILLDLYPQLMSSLSANQLATEFHKEIIKEKANGAQPIV